MNILKAREFAKTAHKGQLDDDGKDYFETHVAQVVEILQIVTDDPDIISAGYLHDTLEDTDTKYINLLDEFGYKIANLVLEVTHEGTKDDKGYYFPRLHSKEAILIKFADRLSNISRMDSWDKARQEQYLRKSKFWKDKP